jgi:hypothetical protein
VRARHGEVAVVIGEQRPAMSISWEPPGPGEKPFYIIFMADLFPDDEGFDDLPQEMACLHCLIGDGDEQLGRGLDLARLFGQVDWDEEAGKWFVPADHWQKGEA